MKTTRRDFLKGLFATGATLAVAPHLLVEPVHGASDLTPQERDVAAEVMGLRTKQWRGTNLELWINGEWQSTWEQKILYGVPGGEMPTGVIKIDSGQTPPVDKRDLIGDIANGELHIKFTESETFWDYGYVGKSPLESVSWRFLKSLPPLRPQWNMYDPEPRALDGPFIALES